MCAIANKDVTISGEITGRIVWGGEGERGKLIISVGEGEGGRLIINDCYNRSNK